MTSRFRAGLWLLVLFNALFLAAVALLPRGLPARAWVAPAVANVVLAAWLLASRRRPSSPSGAEHAVEWPVALLTLESGGKIAGCNQAARALFGLSESGALLSSITHPEEEPLNVRLLASMSMGNARDHIVERRCFGRGGMAFSARWHLRFNSPGVAGRQKAMVLVEDISQLRATQSELERARQSLSDLHNIVSGQRLEEQVGALLDLGRRRFHVETALVSQEREGKMRLLHVRSQDPRLRRSSSYTLEQTRQDGPLRRPLGPRGLAHAGFECQPNQPAPTAVFVHAGETYLGAPIIVEGTVWGGLHFSDAEEREGIGEEDRQFLLTMASWLGGEIERRQARARLEEQQKELLEAAVQLENLAVRDGLTGAKNRRAFDEHLASEWARSRRYRTPLSLVLLDVDKFKLFNDSFGHPAGDEVLKKVAQVLGDSIRNIDFLARYGGEEFVLLLPNTDAQGAMIVAQRLREHIETAQWLLRPVTASFGVATIGASTIGAEMKAPSELLQAADGALYRSKEAGRNCVTHAGAVAEVEG